MCTLYHAPLILMGLCLGQTTGHEARYHPTQVLVRFKAGTADNVKQTAHRAGGALRTIKRYGILEGLQLVEVPSGKVPAVVNAYRRNPNVLYAEPNYRRELASYCVEPCIDCPSPPLEGEDEFFAQQWGLAKINAEQAWCWFGGWTGSSTFKIAVIDSGVNYTHEDLIANIWKNLGECPGGSCAPNGVDDDGNGYIDDIRGWDFASDDNNPMDNFRTGWHGTHMAGIIGAKGNNISGIAGVNWQCDIVPLSLGNATRWFDVAHFVGAMDYVINKNIKVSNNSWGASDFSQAEHDAIKAAGDQIGHIFVAAAGNKNDDNDSLPFFPASYDLPYIISVAATDQSDNRYFESSNKGSHWGRVSVDLGAPGVDILSTVGPGAGLYEERTGTSESTAHVTGVVALVWSRNPGWTYDMVRDRVLWSVRPVSSLSPGGSTPTVTGGVLDALAAVWDCNGNNVPDETDIGNGTSTDCTGNGTPDECEPDCNTNGLADSCDIDSGTSQDCTGNGIPDECEPDCNGNQAPDSCDIFSGASPDCDLNGVPDECQCATPSALDACNVDCNGNSIYDLCDIEGGTSQDCNNNGVPDECDPDCDGDGIPDDCDPDCCVHADCGSGQVCCNHLCEAQECCDDSDCTDPFKPRCRPWDKVCVLCYDDSHCGSNCCCMFNGSCFCGPFACGEFLQGP